MKISRLKLFNSVKVGGKEKTFFDTPYIIEMEGNLISIKDEETKDPTLTTIFNVVWMIENKKVSISEPRKSKTSTKRVTKKK
jgi:hypothetical protein